MRPGRCRLAVLLAALLWALASCATTEGARFPDPPLESPAAEGTRYAVLAGGCFWGMEAVFERLDGVTEVVSGYTGGSADTAFYEAVSMGETGHAESVRIAYDPARIRYGTLLKVFFSVAHDPTRNDAAYPDVGTQYRSAIFFSEEEEHAQALAYIETLGRRGVYAGPITTQVVPLEVFYPAEEYHQEFVARHPKLPYVVAWDLPLLEKLRTWYPELLAG